MSAGVLGRRRRWKALFVRICSRPPVTRCARANGVGLPWKTVAARPVGLETQERQRLVGSARHRKRKPEQRAPRGSKWVKRRDPQHPPASIRRAGNRRETRVLIFDKWVARSRSTGLASGLASARGSGLYRTWVRLRESRRNRAVTPGTKGPFCLTSLTDGHGIGSRTPQGARGIEERGASGRACPTSLNRKWDALWPWAGRSLLREQ